MLIVAAVFFVALFLFWPAVIIGLLSLAAWHVTRRVIG